MKFISHLKYFAVLLSAGLLSVLAGCGGGGTSTTGTLNLSLTDAPSCGYEQVWVTVNSVRVHQSADAQEGDAGWSENILSTPVHVDLLSLTNGVLATLGQAALPAGHYSQMRLVLASNGASAPYANSVVPDDGVETPLDTPSAQQTGLKMNVNIDIEADKVADFVLDFDACKSVVARGHSDQFNLKPVVTVIPVLSDAGQRIVGYVHSSVAATASVSVQSAGVVIKATPPNPTTGQFVLYPVPAGTYDLVVTAPDHVSSLIGGVPVTTTAYTYVGSETNVILPPDSASSETASGTVSVGGSVVDTLATVRALQTAGGTTIEVAGMPVNAADGTFSLTLPLGAPVYTAYNADTSVAITFTPDDAMAGLFNLEASAPGQTAQQSPIDLNLGPSTTNFAF